MTPDRYEPSTAGRRRLSGFIQPRAVKSGQPTWGLMLFGSLGSQGDQSAQFVQEETWSAAWILEQPRNLELKDAVELRYELPAQAQPTRLMSDRPVFWELEVNLSLPGLDFKDTYLVPIYGAGSPARIQPIKLNR